MNQEAATPSMFVGLACGCEATLKKNIADGLDLVNYRRHESCKRHVSSPTVPSSVAGFGPLWTWDANRSDRRELPATTVSRFEPEHLYKLLEGYFYLNEPGKGYPGYGPVSKIHWLVEAHAHP